MFVVDLEKELVGAVKKKYPNYTSSLKGSEILGGSITNSNPHENSSVSDVNKLKSNIKDYMNSMLIQIHNDVWLVNICARFGFYTLF